jgi:uncharacterized lipoprotein YehR (DUF1307 family)
MIEWVLGIIASLLAGTNIYQLFCYRSMKEKLSAEAKTASVEAEHKEIDLHQDQYDYLLRKLSEFQHQYFEMSSRLQQETQKHLEVINAKCNELAELKSKLIYFKGLRCYKSDCSMRIKINPKDTQESNN